MKAGFASIYRLGVITLFLGHLITASAAVFTNDIVINATNTNYDGQGVVISNCTVTVDGPHSFASLLVGTGGVLTHKFYPGGSFNVTVTVSNEPQILLSTNSVTLANSNVVLSSVAVRDSTGTATFTNGVDYVLTQPGD